MMRLPLSLSPLHYLAVLSLSLTPIACGGCGDDPLGGGDLGVDMGQVIPDGGDTADSGDPADTGDNNDTGGGDTGDAGPVADMGGGPDAMTGDSGANINNPNNDMRDSDCDGLSDQEEFSTTYPPSGLRTDPSNPDSDGDGIPDGVELGRTMPVMGSGCPALPDADPTTTTSPVEADTDADGIDDGVEDVNRNGAIDPSESNPRARDSDGDGLDDALEDANQNGLRDPGELDPTNRDTDGDLISDGVEDANRDGVFDAGETDPLNRDTDGDGLSDGEEDTNQNGIREPFEIDPRTPDTDCDGISDGDELTVYMTSPLVPDTDGDGITDGIEVGITAAVPGSNCPGLLVDLDPGSTTDPLDTDSDNDGLADGIEDSNMNGRVDPGETDPNDDDSDGDGVGDGDEVLAGFDPLDPLDPPNNQGPGINAICSTANLKVVDFDMGATLWTVASEQSTAYAAVTVTGGAGVDVAALDDNAGGMAGFVVRMPLIAGSGATAAQQVMGLQSRLQAGVAAANLSYALRLSGRSITSHDGYDTVVSTVLDIGANPTLRPSVVRNRLLEIATGLPSTAFTGLLTTTGAASTEHVFTFQLLVRAQPQEVIIIGGALPRTVYDDPADNSSILLADLSNGTSLAELDAERDKDCDPFVAAGQSVADFIWMADISGSTDDDRSRISTAATLIVNALQTNGVDFRMGVVPHTESDIAQGAGNGGDLRGTGFVRDPALFASYLLDTTGNDGCEFGLDAGRSAISKALPRTAAGVENARRFRDGAIPVMVYISDEYAQEITEGQTGCAPNPSCNTGIGDYYSTGNNNNICLATPNGAQQTCINNLVQPFVDQITANNGVAFAQVIVPAATPTNCTGYGCPQAGSQPANEPGVGYVEVVNGTGGAFYTPCSDQPGAALQAIVDAVSGAASQFQLGGSPISSTLKVGVVRLGAGGNGMVEVVPRDKDDGFDYDAASNSIFFRGFTYRPNQDDVVVVSYRNWQPPEDPCGPCAANQQCDPQLGICTCTQAACAACGANETCDANCNCACTPDCNGNCGPNEVCNTGTCACECAPDCGGACGPGTVCNPTTCACDCAADCGGACAGTNLVCNPSACNCQCPADCGGTCTGNTVCNPSACDCTCPADCADDCPGNAACNPANDCACECPADCGGCPDGTMCNSGTCACECAPNCADTCTNNEVCDPGNSCDCICPADCGGCQANETCDQANCRCIPVV